MRSAPRFPLYFLICCCPQEISDRLRLFREQTNEKVSLEGWQIGKTNSIRISEGHNSALILQLIRVFISVLGPLRSGNWGLSWCTSTRGNSYCFHIHTWSCDAFVNVSFLCVPVHEDTTGNCNAVSVLR